MAKEEKCVAIVRLRGNVNISWEREYIFKLMHLTRKNHTTLVQTTPSMIGSIRKIQDYSTWGEIDQSTIKQLLTQRAFLKGNQPLSDDILKNTSEYSSIAELATAMFNLEVKLNDIPDLKPVFRLHPPRGGFKHTIKKPYPIGELGYRGRNINELIATMI
jgi:large subunit ribosomal protein L30